MILLAVVSINAMAEWVEVGVNDFIGSTFYADTETISKSGNKVKMWVMYDYKTAHDVVGDNFGKYMSTKNHNEYDCKEAKGYESTIKLPSLRRWVKVYRRLRPLQILNGIQ